MKNNEEDRNRVLGIDPGTRRYGLAVSDPLGITAQGLETFEPAGKSALTGHICDIINRYSIGLVVLGMPLSMGGKDIEGTDRSRKLAALIESECGVEVVMRDERMTSLEAERLLKQEGRIREAGDIDRISAVLLLQGYLDERNG